MSIVTSVMGKLGIIGSRLPKVHEFKLNLVRISASKAVSERSKSWASRTAAEEFQKNQRASRALNESMARLPLAR